ncbi:hypothetical protein [Haladaptatus sp. DFWS20]|uniref:hypothetical protein n=1 Tax=Haladaptatus sp. DFWS20 TaxID=3403467 RepID=UPI003EBB03EC
MTVTGGLTGARLETVGKLLTLVDPATVAGPVVLWPLLLVFIGGLLVGAVWSLLRG